MSKIGKRGRARDDTDKKMVNRERYSRAGGHEEAMKNLWVKILKCRI